MKTSFENFLHATVDFFFPPQCRLCGSFLSSYQGRYFCKRCFESFIFIDSPLCSHCGMFFKSKEAGNHLCGRCIKKKTYFDLARSVCVYEGVFRKAIHAFKYKNKAIMAKGPHYRFQIGDMESFSRNFQAMQDELVKQGKYSFDVEFKERESIGDLLSWLPLILIVVVFFFLMRRMSGECRGNLLVVVLR